jgi:hypothetical protein
VEVQNEKTRNLSHRSSMNGRRVWRGNGVTYKRNGNKRGKDYPVRGKNGKEK